jgi:ABC-type nitrate/sulfonate/bicarbonate transport system substrate-binding protein
MSRYVGGISILVSAFIFTFHINHSAAQQSNTTVSTLKVNIFPAGFNWPLWVGEDQGFFLKNKLEVELILTPNSVAQMSGLIEGRFDMAQTAIDNVIAYVEGQGEAKLSSEPDITAFMGGDSAFLSLVVAPDVKTAADLRGKNFSVDALTTGFAFVLRRMLEKEGLSDVDYKIERVGGMVQRFTSLMEGKQAGTLLVPPFTFLSADKGYREYGSAIDLLGSYQGNVVAARRGWLRDHHDETIGFIRAYVSALDWLYDTTNRENAVTIFQKRLTGSSRSVAEKSYDVLVSPRSGFSKKAELDLSGIRTVMELRSRYGEPRKNLTDPTRYYDQSFYNDATKR